MHGGTQEQSQADMSPTLVPNIRTKTLSFGGFLLILKHQVLRNGRSINTTDN